VDTQSKTVRLPGDLYERLRLAAFKRHVPQNTLIVDAIDAHLRWLEAGHEKEVDHKDGDPLNNDPANLEVRERS
jgi:predicted transcriptional regulator